MTCSPQPQPQHRTRTSVSILILETDVLPASAGKVSTAFEKLFSRAGAEQHPRIDVAVTPHYVVDCELPPVEDLQKYDGVLITGSKYDAHGDDAWIMKLVEWIQVAWRKYPDTRFTGVCFGHQILARAVLGATVKNHPTTWELAATEVELSSLGRELFATGQETLVLHQMHQDYVDLESDESCERGCGGKDLKPNVWGSSKDCPVQGFYVHKRIFTTQGHLGYDEVMVRESIEEIQERGGLPRDKEVEAAKEAGELEHDGDIVAGAILRFLAEWDDDIRP